MDYNAEKYWAERLSCYGFSLRGVGWKDRSEQKNEQAYLETKKAFLNLCHQEKLVNLEDIRILDVGCGNGFYAKVLLENNATNYLGVDITDVLFVQLRRELPGFRFLKLDISTQELPEEFDLIIMLDVTQHIVNDAKFSFAMQNVKCHLSAKGVFIVTSWLDGARNTFYEVSRSLDKYKKQFPGYVFSQPMPYKGKYIFSIKEE